MYFTTYLSTDSDIFTGLDLELHITIENCQRLWNIMNSNNEKR